MSADNAIKHVSHTIIPCNLIAQIRDVFVSALQLETSRIIVRDLGSFCPQRNFDDLLCKAEKLHNQAKAALNELPGLVQLIRQYPERLKALDWTQIHRQIRRVCYEVKSLKENPTLVRLYITRFPSASIIDANEGFAAASLLSEALASFYPNEASVVDVPTLCAPTLVATMIGERERRGRPEQPLVPWEIEAVRRCVGKKGSSTESFRNRVIAGLRKDFSEVEADKINLNSLRAALKRHNEQQNRQKRKSA